jgi:hypothetical protein
MFRSEGREEDDVLSLDSFFGKLVHFLVPLEKDAVPVSEVKNTREGSLLAIILNLLDDRVRHGVQCKRLLLDLLSGCQAEKLVSPL